MYYKSPQRKLSYEEKQYLKHVEENKAARYLSDDVYRHQISTLIDRTPDCTVNDDIQRGSIDSMFSKINQLEYGSNSKLLPFHKEIFIGDTTQDPRGAYQDGPSMNEYTKYSYKVAGHTDQKLYSKNTPLSYAETEISDNHLKQNMQKINLRSQQSRNVFSTSQQNKVFTRITSPTELDPQQLNKASIKSQTYKEMEPNQRQSVIVPTYQQAQSVPDHQMPVNSFITAVQTQQVNNTGSISDIFDTFKNRDIGVNIEGRNDDQSIQQIFERLNTHYTNNIIGKQADIFLQQFENKICVQNFINNNNQSNQQPDVQLSGFYQKIQNMFGQKDKSLSQDGKYKQANLLGQRNAHLRQQVDYFQQLDNKQFKQICVNNSTACDVQTNNQSLFQQTDNKQLYIIFDQLNKLQNLTTPQYQQQFQQLNDQQAQISFDQSNKLQGQSTPKYEQQFQLLDNKQKLLIIDQLNKLQNLSIPQYQQQFQQLDDKQRLLIFDQLNKLQSLSIPQYQQQFQQLDNQQRLIVTDQFNKLHSTLKSQYQQNFQQVKDDKQRLLIVDQINILQNAVSPQYLDLFQHVDTKYPNSINAVNYKQLMSQNQQNLQEDVVQSQKFNDYQHLSQNVLKQQLFDVKAAIQKVLNDQYQTSPQNEFKITELQAQILSQCARALQIPTHPLIAAVQSQDVKKIREQIVNLTSKQLIMSDAVNQQYQNQQTQHKVLEARPQVVGLQRVINENIEVVSNVICDIISKNSQLSTSNSLKSNFEQSKAVGNLQFNTLPQNKFQQLKDKYFKITHLIRDKAVNMVDTIKHDQLVPEIQQFMQNLTVVQNYMNPQEISSICEQLIKEDAYTESMGTAFGPKTSQSKREADVEQVLEKQGLGSFCNFQTLLRNDNGLQAYQHQGPAQYTAQQSQKFTQRQLGQKKDIADQQVDQKTQNFDKLFTYANTNTQSAQKLGVNNDVKYDKGLLDM